MARDIGNVFPDGGGACGELARSLDWGKTLLGPTSSWSSSLKTMAVTVLFAPHPMLLMWGPEYVTLYNDAFVKSFRDGAAAIHPHAFGAPFVHSWPELWSSQQPMLDRIVSDAQPVFRDNELFCTRIGTRLVESYWTFCDGPVFDHDLSVGGVLAVTRETTACVLSERRGKAIRAIVLALSERGNGAELLGCTLDALCNCPEARFDVPFVAAYAIVGETLRPTYSSATDTATAHGLEAAARQHLEDRRSPRKRRTAGPITIPPLSPSPQFPWPESVTRTYCVSIPRCALEPPNEVIVFGVSPRLRFDVDYRAYLERIVDALVQARARCSARDAQSKLESERRAFLERGPMASALLTGPDFTVEVVNETVTELLGRKVTGQTFAEAFPKLVDTEVHRILQRAYLTGRPFSSDEQLVTMQRSGGPAEDRWFKFNIQPILDHNGIVMGMMLIAVDITEFVIARRTVEQYANDREKLLEAAEAANRAKDEFLAMLGHELRNPLAPITTALHLMKLKAPTLLVREREIIARQASHLVKLVDDLLDVSRVVRGKVTLNRCRVGLADVIARAVEIATPLFEEKRHSLVVDVPAERLDVHGDAMRLSQVFANLLTNAAKYTEPGGRIVVSGGRLGETAIVRVEDNGVGISPQQVPRIFDMFFQAQRSPDRAEGGLGLGLAIVKSFVTLHGGNVSVSSKEGAGSVFEVRLPALPYAEVPESTANSAAAATPLPHAGKRRVLLVDDSEDILEIVASFLRHEGYEVLAAHDAPDALRFAPSFHPDVAVIDIGLPAMDGYDLAAHLREELGDATPKLIAMTGYGQEADRQRALRAGFDVHLVKPVDPSDLLASVAR
jgi:PAS domain S-box-containing protein